MAFQFRTPGGERTTNAVLTMFWGSLLCFFGIRFWSTEARGMAGWMLLALGVPLLLSGVFLWFRKSWARWPAVAILGLMVAAQGWAWATLGFDLWRTFLLIALGWTAVDVFRLFSPTSLALAAAEESYLEDPDKPMTSLVLLLRRPRFLDSNGLARYAEAAWGGSFRVHTDGDSGANTDQDTGARWVGGRSPLLFVHSPDGLFIVHNHDQPYFEDSPRLASRLPDLRLRRVIEDNRAWLAVDLIKPVKPVIAPETHYAIIGKLVAALAGPDCQAVYRPETQEFNHWDDSLEEKLRGPDALDLFSHPTQLPVIEVPDDDPRMKAAVAEARQRWPEFVSAFQNQAGEYFSVKAPVRSAGNTEFIWIHVDALEEDAVRGRLGNDPVDLGHLKEGDAVTVPLSEVNDWAFLQAGQPIGMFTVSVLQAVQREATEGPGSYNSAPR